MGFEIPVDMERDVERYAEAAHITPDEAVRRIVADGLRSGAGQSVKRGPRLPLRTTNPESTIGLFADMPDFLEIMSGVISRREERYTTRR